VLRVLNRPETIKQVTGIVANGFKDSLEVPMFTAYVIVTILAVAANAFSGIAAIVHWRRILPGMIKAGVPESWLTFPIGTLKTAGAVGLLLGLIGVPLIGTAAAIGLILFFVCALYTHVRASDYSPQFGLANGFLALAVASLVLGLAST
jgi:NAD/NADP transhydrogenase alpha subunit